MVAGDMGGKRGKMERASCGGPGTYRMMSWRSNEAKADDSRVVEMRDARTAACLT